MSLSRYQVVSKSDGKVLDETGLKIILLVAVIRSVKDAAGKFFEKQEAENNDISLRFNYFECAKKTLKNIRFNSKSKPTQKKIANIVSELSAEFDAAKAHIDKLGGKMSGISDMVEIWVFFSNVAKNSIDSIKVLEDEEIRHSDTSIGRSYHSKIEINFNGSTWVYNVCNDAKTEVKKQVIVNGVVNPIMSEDAAQISSVLSMVAVMQQKDCVDKRFVDEYSKVDAFVKKAKAITSILGGEWQDYIIFIGSVEETVHEMKRRNLNDGQLKKIVEALAIRDLRASPLEVNEAIKLFLDKPIYH